VRPRGSIGLDWDVRYRPEGIPMTASRGSGQRGEDAVLAHMTYEGWGDIERQYHIGGHVLDFKAKHSVIGEGLHEVKAWEKGGGKDTVKKALWDAVDLKLQGIVLPYTLWLSEELFGNYRDQILRAKAAGFLFDARVISSFSLGEPR
jgi:hypothetical protein